MKMSEETNSLISNVLKSGLILSMTSVLIGLIFVLWNYGNQVIEDRIFTAEPFYIKSIGDILSNTSKFNELGIIQWGIVLLIATPVLRVITCIWMFFVERDFMYVIIATIVLLLLIYSLFFSHGG